MIVVGAPLSQQVSCSSQIYIASSLTEHGPAVTDLPANTPPPIDQGSGDIHVHYSCYFHLIFVATAQENIYTSTTEEFVNKGFLENHLAGYE